MLYLIGLGLGDAKDITVKGLETVRKCQFVYLESYTSILTVGKEALEEFYGKQVLIADRECVEMGTQAILENARNSDVAFLVVGDPLGATTHTDLILRAHNEGIAYKLIHNASIVNAVSSCGLQLYNFGEIVSIPFWTDTWKPDSFFDKICSNLKSGLHTLCLLDIKVKEQSIENLMKGILVYEAPRFMSVNIAASQLLDIIKAKRDENKIQNELINENSKCIALARIGSDDCIRSGSLKEMLDIEMGEPLHSLVIAGKLHALEIEMLNMFENK